MPAGVPDAKTLAALDPDVTMAVAGGSCSSLLAREPDLRLPMQAGKGCGLTLPWPRQSPCSPDGMPHVGRTSRWETS